MRGTPNLPDLGVTSSGHQKCNGRANAINTGNNRLFPVNLRIRGPAGKEKALQCVLDVWTRCCQDDGAFPRPAARHFVAEDAE
jgi:hypothetical protein